MRFWLILLVLSAGCATTTPSGRLSPSPRTVNYLDYEVKRTWELGIEIEVHPIAQSRARREDLEAINRELLDQYQRPADFTIIYRDQDGELAQYSVDGDNWIWRDRLRLPSEDPTGAFPGYEPEESPTPLPADEGP